MKLALIRHLPTLANRDGLLQGRRDLEILPPDEETMQAVSRNAETLSAIGPFDHVLVSRLRRTAMTADIYGFQAVRTTEPLLDELDFGAFEGRPREEMLTEIGDAWHEAPQDLVLGEPMTAVGRRVSQVIDKYERSTRLLVFGHAAWSRALVSILTKGDLSGMNKLKIDNNQLVILEVNSHAREGIREQ